MQSKIQDFAKHAKEIYHKGEGAPLPFVTFAFHLTRLLPRDSQFSQVLVLFEISLLALPLGGFAVMPSQKGLLSVRAYQGTGLVRASLSAGGRADCKSDTARFMKRNSSLVLCFLIPLRIQDFTKHAKEIYHKEQDFLHLSPNISLRYHAAVRSKGASSGIKVRSPLVAGCPLTSLLVFNFPTKTTSIR